MSMPPLITGLYPYVRGGVHKPPVVTLAEIPRSLRVNPMYKDRLMVLAGNEESAHSLKGFGLQVTRTFDDAPVFVTKDMAHKMKHWMCLWALREFGEFLWLDWDTVWMRDPPAAFWKNLRASATPRFIYIPHYWAIVNCGIYYVPGSWLGAMEKSLYFDTDDPNDELLWASVLPCDVRQRREFWWGQHALHIETLQDMESVTQKTYFAHVKNFDWFFDFKSGEKLI